MVLTASPGSISRLRKLRFWALALVALVVAHDAVYLAEYGDRYRAALAATGHGYWLTFALLALVIGGVPIGATVLGLVRLRTSIWRLGRTRVPNRHREDRSAGPSYLGEFVSLLPRLFAVVLIGFAFQENVESLAAGNGLAGLRVLDLMSLQVLFAIAFLVALAGAWLRWREVVLQRRFAAATRQNEQCAQRHGAAHAAPGWGEIAAIVAHGWLMARRLAGRAPPALRAV